MESNEANTTVDNESSIGYKLPFNRELLDEFEFTAPQEAPIFKPSVADFRKGPLEYIRKIRPFAEKYGICKIIPPPDFRPEFEADTEKFTFKPRVQRINELEALTLVEKRMLDFYTLHRTVSQEGGFESCVREKKWIKIAQKLYPNATTKSQVANQLRQHYEKFLYPYDIFVSGATMDIGNENDVSPTTKKLNTETSTSSASCTSTSATTSSSTENIPSTSTASSSPVECGRMSRRSSARQAASASNSASNGSSFSRLMRGNQDIQNVTDNTDNSSLTNGMSTCSLCSQSDRTRRLLQCEHCERHFHLACLFPPLNTTPKGHWNCARCVAQLVPTLPQPYTAEFGFSESRRRYTLAEFGMLANDFKSKYFDVKEIYEISLPTVEKEFWRLVSNIEDQITVEYGADLHTNQVGSGFATRKENCTTPNTYADHPWNLNRLPLLEGSLFKYINSNINGMIVPWIYVGMCFSTFCWHNEDHWTYSINYLHWGEAKTWYGVPGDAAPEFESAMQKIAPELFGTQPDLLHQLVTICNPNLLQKRNVPIYRLDQMQGEFIVTFPRSYHAGFNQGFNLAEAVNFAPVDWLHLGSQCVKEYARLRRYPVFSHEELLFRMAADVKLPATYLSALFFEMLDLVRAERDHRKRLFDLGVRESSMTTFDKLTDEERQCKRCRSTFYMCALICACAENNSQTSSMVCLSHSSFLCDKCPSHKWRLLYTHPLDELLKILQSIENRLRSFEEWMLEAKSCLRINDDNQQLSLQQNDEELPESTAESPTYEQLKQLKKTADRLFASGPTYSRISQYFNRAKRFMRRMTVLRRAVDGIKCEAEERFTCNELREMVSLLESGCLQVSENDQSILEGAKNFCEAFEWRLEQLVTVDEMTMDESESKLVRKTYKKMHYLNLDDSMQKLVTKFPFVFQDL